MTRNHDFVIISGASVCVTSEVRSVWTVHSASFAIQLCRITLEWFPTQGNPALEIIQNSSEGVENKFTDT